MLKTKEKPMPAVSRLAEFLKGQAILLEYLACAPAPEPDKPMYGQIRPIAEKGA